MFCTFTFVKETDFLGCGVRKSPDIYCINAFIAYEISSYVAAPPRHSGLYFSCYNLLVVFFYTALKRTHVAELDVSFPSLKNGLLGNS